MKIFNRPTNLNGSELIDELKAAGINASRVADYLDGTIGVDVNDEVAAQSIIANHNGTIIPPQPTAAEKLAAAGLTVEELKEVLGL